VAYTPGVAAPCLEIAKDKELVYKYTSKQHLVAIITDGTAVLGLGDIGPEASLPVMEGKAVLFKEFANLDAFPIALATKDVNEIVETVKRIAPIFGAINLEDISAPRCFEIEERLKKELDIPVFHDDQHGTAIVVLAGLINALKLTGKTKDAKVVLSGAGAAGIAIAKVLLAYGFRNITLVDRAGAIFTGRKENMNSSKEEIATLTNKTEAGSLAEVLKGADIFLGVSSPNLVTTEMVASMNEPIIFAMANPDPEILPEEAKAGGAKIIATGRSDYPNQINNVLAFPGVLKGALESRAKDITQKMKLAAAEAITAAIEPTPEEIIPSPFTKGLAEKVADAVKNAVK
jgi:malate dehydrogenase (oxaloacetate-decarboxylating)